MPFFKRFKLILAILIFFAFLFIIFGTDVLSFFNFVFFYLIITMSPVLIFYKAEIPFYEKFAKKYSEWMQVILKLLIILVGIILFNLLGISIYYLSGILSKGKLMLVNFNFGKAVLILFLLVLVNTLYYYFISLHINDKIVILLFLLIYFYPPILLCYFAGVLYKRIFLDMYFIKYSILLSFFILIMILITSVKKRFLKYMGKFASFILPIYLYYFLIMY